MIPRSSTGLPYFPLEPWCPTMAYSPSDAGMAIDDQHTTTPRLHIILSKPLPGKLHEERYRAMATHLPSNGGVLESGSQPAFQQDFMPQLVASELSAASGAIASNALWAALLVLTRSGETFGGRLAHKWHPSDSAV